MIPGPKRFVPCSKCNHRIKNILDISSDKGKLRLIPDINYIARPWNYVLNQMYHKIQITIIKTMK